MSESKTLTKSALAQGVHATVGLSKKESSAIIDDVLDIIQDALSEGENIKISCFGSFIVRDKAARRGRNPQTGESMIITRRRVLRFKPSQRLRDEMNPLVQDQS
jgi:integration host factor subunit alpha